MNSKSTQKVTVKRLEYLCSMLIKYAHCWNPGNDVEPSQRMYDWVDEYNNLKAYNRPAWEAYCREYGFTLDHDAYDCMA